METTTKYIRKSGFWELRFGFFTIEGPGALGPGLSFGGLGLGCLGSVSLGLRVNDVCVC